MTGSNPLHVLVWCWYLETHPAGHTWIPSPGTPQEAPRFLDALAPAAACSGPDE